MDIQERIAAAKKEMESLKERIKQKKDALADTTRMFISFLYRLLTFIKLCGKK